MRCSYLELLRLGQLTIRGRLEKNSESPYNTGWDSWCEFCDDYGFSVRDKSEERIVAWATYTKLRRGVSADTLRVYAYGIQSELKAGWKSKKTLKRYAEKRTAALVLRAALKDHDIEPPQGLCDARGAR